MTQEEFNSLKAGDMLRDSAGYLHEVCGKFPTQTIKCETELNAIVPEKWQLVSKRNEREACKPSQEPERVTPNPTKQLIDKIEELTHENIELQRFNSTQDAERPKKYVYDGSVAHSERDFYKNMVLGLQAISAQLDYIIRQTL